MTNCTRRDTFAGLSGFQSMRNLSLVWTNGTATDSTSVNDAHKSTGPSRATERISSSIGSVVSLDVRSHQNVTKFTSR
tara:strand:- start:1585 stop:1818 length:234 start_codon:yes stop_codon:yes gene_type:complete